MLSKNTQIEKDLGLIQFTAQPGSGNPTGTPTSETGIGPPTGDFGGFQLGGG